MNKGQNERSGGGRGAVLDGSQGGVIDRRNGEAASRSNAWCAKDKLGEGGLRERSDHMEDGVRVGGYVIAPQAGVGFDRILNRLQVVGYRDNRKQDQKKQSQGDKLPALVKITLVRASARGKSQPQAEHKRRLQKPCEIENQFHALG